MHLIIQIKTFKNENSPIPWYDWIPPVFSYITTPLLAWGVLVWLSVLRFSLPLRRLSPPSRFAPSPNNQINMPLLFYRLHQSFSSISQRYNALAFCFEWREITRATFRCISGHWFSSDSFRALPKPANGQPVGSQIFKPPTPDLRGMPLRLAQTNGVCLNQ